VPLKENRTVGPFTIAESTFRHHGWDHTASDYYYNSPSRGSTTHIHIGGSTRSGGCTIKFISIKVNDSFAGKIYDLEKFGGMGNWGMLDTIDLTVASEFRKALGAIGIY
jgi:hypothetical protein